ncbi:MAG: universal stress protein [Myxococcota bacterium]|nr:universal stress protein [Myxococcota bacterium]
MPVVTDILCPIDFSPSSERAARFAVDLATGMRAQLHLAHVLPLPMPSMPVPELGLMPQEAILPPTARLSTDARDALFRLAGDLGVDAAVHVVSGTAAREIVTLAEALGVGMIVMGTHGRTGLAHLLLGSVAERVMRTAHLPVLVVPAHDRRGRADS